MAKKAARKAPAKKAKKAAAKKAAPRKAARRASAAPRAAAQPKWKWKGSQDVIVNLVLRDAAAAIEFYKNALGAKELSRHAGPGGKGIMHAEVQIGDTRISLNDEMPGGPSFTIAAGPNHKPTSSFFLYTPDCDALYHRAVQNGAHPGMPPADMFWGDRMGSVTDPFGQVWMISTHQKDLSPEELERAGEQAMAQMAQQQQQSPGGQTPPSAAAH